MLYIHNNQDLSDVEAAPYNWDKVETISVNSPQFGGSCRKNTPFNDTSEMTKPTFSVHIMKNPNRGYQQKTGSELKQLNLGAGIVGESISPR